MCLCVSLQIHFLQGVLAEAIVYCGSLDCQYPGQIEIFEESSKKYQKPTRIISLLDIKHDPGIQASQPNSSLSFFPTQQSSQKSSVLGITPSSTLPDVLWPFKIFLISGEAVDFFLETQKNCQDLVSKLGFLLLFPYSPIPKESSHTPVMDSFSSSLCSEKYQAGGYGVSIFSPIC